MTAAARGLLFVVSAPSGTGKTTLVERLVADRARTWRCRGPTPRAQARAGETDGVDYNFITRERFEAMVARGRVPRVGRRLRQPLRDRRADTERRWPRAATWCSSSTSRAPGRCGSAALDAVGIFVLPPSFEVLEQRLRGRSKDCEEHPPAARRRRAGSPRRSTDYDYVIVNDELERASTAAGDRPGRTGAPAIGAARGRRDRQDVRRQPVADAPAAQTDSVSE